MKSEIKKGVIIGYISIFASTFISIFFTPFLIKYLGTSDYGVYTLISSVMAYFSILDLGLGSTAVRYISKNYKNKQEVSKINGFLLKIYLIISLLALIIGTIIFINASKIFISLTQTEITKFKLSLIIATITLALSFPFSICSSYIMAHEKFVFQKLLSLIQNISKPIIFIPLLLCGYKSVTLIFALAIISTGIYISNFLYSKIKLDFKISFQKMNNDKKIIKEMFGYSFFILLAMIVDTVFNNTDQVILAAYSGTFAVSVYNISMLFRNANTNLSSVISQLFFPRLTKMVNEKKSMKEVSDIFITVSRIQLYVLLFVFSSFIIFGKQFIVIWVGKEFIDAYYIVLICLLPSLVPLSQNIGIYVLQAMNMHKFRSLVFFAIAILNVAISIPLSKIFAGIGAAIGTSIAMILGQIICMNIYYYKVIKLDIKLYWKNFLKITIPILLLSIFFSIVLNRYVSSLILLIMFGFIYIMCYCIYLYVFLFNSYEKRLFISLINKLKKKVGIVNEKND